MIWWIRGFGFQVFFYPDSRKSQSHNFRESRILKILILKFGNPDQFSRLILKILKIFFVEFSGDFENSAKPSRSYFLCLIRCHFKRKVLFTTHDHLGLLASKLGIYQELSILTKYVYPLLIYLISKRIWEKIVSVPVKAKYTFVICVIF